MDKQEINNLLNRQVPRVEKMQLLVSFLSENKVTLSDEDFVYFLKRYLYMLSEEYEDSPTLPLAEDYSFTLLLLCEKLIRVDKTWECTPLVGKTIALLNDFAKKGDAKTKKWKFETWYGIAEKFADTHRYRQALESYAEALKYSSAAEEFDASDFFYIMMRTAHYLGLKDFGFIVELIKKYWVDNPPQNIEVFIGKMHFDNLRTDMVENTEEYLKIKDELEEKIYQATKHLTRRMGYCFTYWSEKERILKEDYGIEWKSPSVLNPHILFD